MCSGGQTRSGFSSVHLPNRWSCRAACHAACHAPCAVRPIHIPVVLGCARLCSAVLGRARLCSAVLGRARLCSAVSSTVGMGHGGAARDPAPRAKLSPWHGRNEKQGSQWKWSAITIGPSVHWLWAVGCGLLWARRYRDTETYPLSSLSRQISQKHLQRLQSKRAHCTGVSPSFADQSRFLLLCVVRFEIHLKAAIINTWSFYRSHR